MLKTLATAAFAAIIGTAIGSSADASYITPKEQACLDAESLAGFQFNGWLVKRSFPGVDASEKDIYIALKGSQSLQTIFDAGTKVVNPANAERTFYKMPGSWTRVDGQTFVNNWIYDLELIKCPTGVETPE